jgi:hypothetical protein
MNSYLPTVDTLKAQAEKVYDRARDQGKDLAVLTIADALLDAHAAGFDRGVTARVVDEIAERGRARVLSLPEKQP